MGSISSNSGSLSNNLSGDEEIFEDGIVHGGQSPAVGNLLLVVRPLVDDGSLSDHESMLFFLLGQIVDDLLDLRLVLFVVGVRHVNHEGRGLIFFVIGEFEFFDVGDFGVFEGLSVLRIGAG